MTTQSGNQRGRFFSKQMAAYSGLVLAALFAFSGCATMPDASETAPAKSSAQSAHAEVIILREGDVIHVSFAGNPSMDTTQQIRRDGKISLALVGEVQAAGLTPEDLQNALIKLYSTQIESKQISVSLQSSTFPLFVTGAVLHPGKITSDHPITALDAIMEAGGFDETTANEKAVRIIRNEDGVMKHYTVDLKSVLSGDASKPFYLKPQDIIYVPQRFVLF